MIDLLLPSTDLGVLAQVGSLIVLGALAIYATRRQRDWQLVAIGTTLLIVGFFGLRAHH